MGSKCCGGNEEKRNFPPITSKSPYKNSENINISILVWDNNENAESNLSSKNLPLIFESSEEEYINKKIKKFLEKIIINKYFLLINFKTQSIGELNSNKIIKDFNEKKDLKKIYIYWINEIEDLSKININDNYLIGTSIQEENEIKNLINDVKKKNLNLKIVKQNFNLINRQSETILDFCQENNIYFFSDLIMENGALSGKYNSNNLMPENSIGGEIYNSKIDKIDSLNKELQSLLEKKSKEGDKNNKNNNAKIFQIPISWAICKGTFPLIKINEFENENIDDIIKSKDINLSEDEIVILERNVDELIK